jgi:hypothetical protein
VSVLLGNGDGTFQAASRTYPAGQDPFAVVAGSFRGNGIVDLAVADNALFRGTSGVSVLLGNGDGTFGAAHLFTAGLHPRALAVGDFRGDGILDLAVANEGTFPDYRDSSVSVLLGKGDGTFEAPITYPTGPDPTSVAVADLTGKGILDLVVTNFRGNTVSVLLGNGDGTFGDAGHFAAGTNPISVAAFKSNGIYNLAVTNYNTTGSVSILLGNGDGTFQAPVSYPAGDHPDSVAVGDFRHKGIDDLVYVHDAASGGLDVLLGNGDGSFRAGGSFVSGSGSAGLVVAPFSSDGELDVAVANNADDMVSVLDGNGDGEFRTPDSLVGGEGPASLVVADLLGNGISDLVALNDSGGRGSVSVFLGNGDGTFQAARNYDVGPSPNCLAVGDLRGNRILDIVVGLNQVNQSISVLLGNGDGTFQAPRRYDASNDSAAIVIADFDNDGIPDLAVANIVTNNVSLLLGNGDGTFQPPRNFSVGSGTYPRSLVVGDFSGDGMLDLAVADEGDIVTGAGSGVSILLGNGNGTFRPARTFAAGRNPWSLLAQDLTGNGVSDLLVADAAVFGGTPGVSVLLGNGDGTFGAPRLFAAGNGPEAMAFGDFNGNGTMSLAVAGRGGTRVLQSSGDGTFQTTNVAYVTGWSESLASIDSGNGIPILAVAARPFGRIFLLSNDALPSPSRRGLRGERPGRAEQLKIWPLAIPATELQSRKTQHETAETRDRAFPLLNRLPSVSDRATRSEEPAPWVAGLVDRLFVTADYFDLDFSPAAREGRKRQAPDFPSF